MNSFLGSQLPSYRPIFTYNGFKVELLFLALGPDANRMLQAGIVGLPNVGKSTLFNALTAQEAALAANYPFATIEPNVGIVAVPDERLEPLAKIVKTTTIVPATVEFVDIAGLVRGASKGEGLGNQFLANIRETDAVIQVVRCFEDDNIIHVEGSVDPVRDIETIQIELALADLASIEKRRDKAARAAKSSGDKDAKREIEILDKIQPVLEEGRPARAADLTDDENAIVKRWFLLTTKPTIYAANVDEETLADPDANPHVRAVMAQAKLENADVVPICAKLEAELVALETAERVEYLKDLGLSSSGVDKLIKAAYHMLGLMSFLTAGEKEVRAWTIPLETKAPKAAGTIHTDIERGFIRAEIVSYDDLTKAGSYNTAREQGLLRLEGKDYIMREGDIVNFRFNV
jgi:GTP-binding protein YchF